jgi:hypothetical protein
MHTKFDIYVFIIFLSFKFRGKTESEMFIDIWVRGFAMYL